MKRFLIIGYGKVGSHLQSALRNSYTRPAVEIIRNHSSKISKTSIEKSDIIFICTQDNRIKSAVKKILSLKPNLEGKIVAHTSGALSSDELIPLKSHKASIASFHPVQTFESTAKRNENRFKDIYIAIEGEPFAKKTLSVIAKKINAVPFYIDKNFKVLHHICCVISSGYLAAHLSFIQDIYRQKIGFKKPNFFGIYMPLIYQTLSNIKAKGIEKSLTGPIFRADLETIQSHIKELKKLPNDILTYYKLEGNKAVKIALDKKSLNVKQAKQLQKIFKIKN